MAGSPRTLADVAALFEGETGSAMASVAVTAAQAAAP